MFTSMVVRETLISPLRVWILKERWEPLRPNGRWMTRIFQSSSFPPKVHTELSGPEALLVKPICKPNQTGAPQQHLCRSMRIFRCRRSWHIHLSLLAILTASLLGCSDHAVVAFVTPKAIGKAVLIQRQGAVSSTTMKKSSSRVDATKSAASSGMPKAAPSQVKGVLLDMDGTMTDSDTLHFEAYRETLAKVSLQSTCCTLVSNSGGYRAARIMNQCHRCYELSMQSAVCRAQHSTVQSNDLCVRLQSSFQLVRWPWARTDEHPPLVLTFQVNMMPLTHSWILFHFLSSAQLHRCVENGFSGPYCKATYF